MTIQERTPTPARPGRTQESTPAHPPLPAHGKGQAHSKGQVGQNDEQCQSEEQELDVFGRFCPSRGMFAELADKWSLLILMSLGKLGEQRFSELQRAVGGVSRKMLTQSLRTLERHGLISRTVHPQTPPRVVYGLLPRGRELADLVAPLGRWTELNTPAMLVACEEFDTSHDTSHDDAHDDADDPARHPHRTA
ncbi:helix-turn-helix transcriptional regulator [Kitasatospora sp. NBC_00240]|uniref:winged helix-turn-helix transcriptional regulator n=1 Tax=Kitasatospora sp. NBC_00240 TaxID=2903567 RepID=UPI00224F6250|nr:helix-turn-helix domain-containing protein [Kitasatospora sp. NBC_00240]MCX5211118.1 helix-turn-helix transcriptional regulator [Kitasatospora sp. NBC_00240]